MSGRALSGSIGEEIAALFLRLKGYEIVKRNVRTRRSEIDIVARRAGCLVFAEVKFRGCGHLVDPADCLDRKKKGCLTRGALSFLRSHSIESYDAVRFDVIAISLTKERLVVEHIKNAFSSEGFASW